MAKTNAEIHYWGFEQFISASKFYSACLHDEINPKCFEPARELHLPGEAYIGLPEWKDFDKLKLCQLANNYLLLALGACAISADEALSNKHGSTNAKNYANNPTDINALREVILIIRSAFAHRLNNVHWVIDKNRRRLYEVNTPNGIVKFDARDKHNTKFEFAHIGGMEGFHKLINFASDDLKE